MITVRMLFDLLGSVAVCSLFVPRRRYAQLSEIPKQRFTQRPCSSRAASGPEIGTWKSGSCRVIPERINAKKLSCDCHHNVSQRALNLV